MKMQNLKIFIVVWAFGLITGLTSCKVNCPDFDEDILSWIPYQADDVIELYSPSNDSTIIFPIESVEATHTTHYPSNSKCACGDYISVNHNSSDFQILISSEGSAIHSQVYRIGETDFYNYSELTDFLFEDKRYEIVMIFEKHDDVEGMFKKLIIAKGWGIIGLIDIYDNTWVLKTNVKKPNTKRNVVIHNVSC
jgi:hypothetical protein